MQDATKEEGPVEICDEQTLFKDFDYLRTALTYFTQSERYPFRELKL